MELIDRAVIMGALTSSEGQATIKAMTGAEAYNYFLSLLCSVPTIDAAPVVHGRWVEYLPVLGAGDLQIRCSECGSTNDVRTRYCPNCGTPMDGGENDD